MKDVLHDRRGSVVLMVAGAMAVLTGMACLAIEVSNVYVGQIRQQRYSDIAASGAAAVVAAHVNGSNTSSTSMALTEAQNLVALNASNAVTVPASGVTTVPPSNSGSGNTAIYDGSVTVGTAESRPLVLSNLVAGAKTFAITGNATANYRSFIVTTTDVTGGYCSVALGGNITIAAGASLNAAGCSVAAGGSLNLLLLASIQANSITYGTTYTNLLGTTHGVAPTKATAAIQDFVYQVPGVATAVDTANNLSLPAFTMPTAPAGCSSATALNYSTGGTKTVPITPSGTTNYYALTLGRSANVQFQGSAPLGNTVICSVTFADNTAVTAGFGMGTYYFTSSSGLTLTSSRIFSFAPGTYYFYGPFAEQSLSTSANSTLALFCTYIGGNAAQGCDTSTGTYYFSAGLTLGGTSTSSSATATINMGAGTYYIAPPATNNYAAFNLYGGANTNVTIGNANQATTINVGPTTTQVTGGGVTLFANVTMNGTGNWNIRDSANQTALLTGSPNAFAPTAQSFGCQDVSNGANAGCVYQIIGNVLFGANSTQSFGQDEFLIAGNLTFDNLDRAASTSGTGVSFIATGNVVVTTGANIDLVANDSVGNGTTSGVVLGSTNGDITFSLLASASLSGVVYAPHGTIYSYLGASEHSSAPNACLQYVSYSLQILALTAVADTCSGFTGTPSMGGSGSANAATSTTTTTTGSGLGNSNTKTVNSTAFVSIFR